MLIIDIAVSGCGYVGGFQSKFTLCLNVNGCVCLCVYIYVNDACILPIHYYVHRSIHLLSSHFRPAFNPSICFGVLVISRINLYTRSKFKVYLVLGFWGDRMNVLSHSIGIEMKRGKEQCTVSQFTLSQHKLICRRKNQHYNRVSN